MSTVSLVIGSLTLTILIFIGLMLYQNKKSIEIRIEKIGVDMNAELLKSLDDVRNDINQLIGKSTDFKTESFNKSENDSTPVNADETLEIQNMVMDMTNMRRVEEMKSRHYSILRKAAKDMIDSIVHIPEFRKNEENIPLPPVDSNPIWSDLVNNHITGHDTNLSKEWRNYMESVNRCTELKMSVLREFEIYLVRGTGLERTGSSSNSDFPDAFYIHERIYDILNGIFFDSALKLDMPEQVVDNKKSRKIKNVDMMVNGKIFVHSTPDTVKLIRDRADINGSTVESFPLESMKQLKSAIEYSNSIADSLTSILNWFIFENTDMIDCHIIDEMKS